MKKVWQMFFLSMGLFLMVFLQGGVAQAAPLSGGSWKVVSSSNLGTSDFLTGVSGVPGTSQAWTVGSYYNSAPPLQTLTEFYS